MPRTLSRAKQTPITDEQLALLESLYDKDNLGLGALGPDNTEPEINLDELEAFASLYDPNAPKPQYDPKQAARDYAMFDAARKLVARQQRQQESELAEDPKAQKEMALQEELLSKQNDPVRNEAILNSEDPAQTLSEIQQLENKVKDEAPEVQERIKQNYYDKRRNPFEQGFEQSGDVPPGRAAGVAGGASLAPIHQEAYQAIGEAGVLGENLDQQFEERPGFWSTLYQGSQRAGAKLGLQAATAPGFLYGLAATPFKKAFPNEKGFDQWEEAITNNPIAEYYSGLVEGQTKEIEKQYDKGITEYLKAGQIDDALGLTAISIVESIPYTAAMMMGGAYGVGMKAMIGATTAMFGGEKNQTLMESHPEMTGDVRHMNSLVDGLAEGLMEQMGSVSVGKMLKDIGLKTAKEVGQKKANEVVKRTILTQLQKKTAPWVAAKSAHKEGLEEMSTSIAQNFNAWATGEDPERDLFEGVMDAYIVGYGSGYSITKAVTTKQKFDQKKDPEEPQTIDLGDGMTAKVSPTDAGLFMNVTNEAGGKVFRGTFENVEEANEALKLLQNSRQFAPSVAEQEEQLKEEPGEPPPTHEDFVLEEIQKNFVDLKNREAETAEDQAKAKGDQGELKEVQKELHEQNRQVLSLITDVKTELARLEEALEYEKEITNNEDGIAEVEAEIARAQADLAGLNELRAEITGTLTKNNQALGLEQKKPKGAKTALSQEPSQEEGITTPVTGVDGEIEGDQLAPVENPPPIVETVPEPEVDPAQFRDMSREEQDQELVNFITAYNAENERGGEYEATKKYGVSLTRADALMKNPEDSTETLPEAIERYPEGHAKKVFERHAGVLESSTDPIERLNSIHAIKRRAASEGAIADDIAAFANDIEAELKSQGYEVVDLTGRNYNEGMELGDAQFVPDKDLADGERIITRVMAPQIMKDGKIVQGASVVVSQGERPLTDEEQAAVTAKEQKQADADAKIRAEMDEKPKELKRKAPKTLKPKAEMVTTINHNKAEFEVWRVGNKLELRSKKKDSNGNPAQKLPYSEERLQTYRNRSEGGRKAYKAAKENKTIIPKSALDEMPALKAVFGASVGSDYSGTFDGVLIGNSKVWNEGDGVVLNYDETIIEGYRDALGLSDEVEVSVEDIIEQAQQEVEAYRERGASKDLEQQVEQELNKTGVTTTDYDTFVQLTEEDLKTEGMTDEELEEIAKTAAEYDRRAEENEQDIFEALEDEVKVVTDKDARERSTAKEDRDLATQIKALEREISALETRIENGDESVNSDIQSGLFASKSDQNQLFNTTDMSLNSIAKIREALEDKRSQLAELKAKGKTKAEVDEGKTTEDLELAPKRFEAGKKLSPEERKEVLKSSKDAFKENDAPRIETEGVNQGGFVYDKIEYLPEAYTEKYMVKSDITGRLLRYYITLPDGRTAHPSELYPELEDKDIQAALRDEAYRIYKEELNAEDNRNTKLNRIVTPNAENKYLFKHDGATVTHDSPEAAANYLYKRSGRSIDDSQFYAHPDGRVVRVDTKAQADVDFYEAEGFKPKKTLTKAPKKELSKPAQVEWTREKVIAALKADETIPEAVANKFSNLVAQRMYQVDIENVKKDIEREEKYIDNLKKELPKPLRGVERTVTVEEISDALTIANNQEPDNTYNSFDVETLHGNYVSAIESLSLLRSKFSDLSERQRQVVAQDKGEQAPKELKKAPPLKLGEPEAPKRKLKKTGEKIENFGEHIGGSAADYYGLLSESRNLSDEEMAAEPLSKTFPQPNYQKLIDGGTDKYIVGLVRAMRDIIPSKPRSRYKVARYVSQVKSVRDMVEKILSGEITRESIRNVLSRDSSTDLSKVLGQADLYEKVGHAQSLKDLRVTMGEYSLYDGVKYDPPKILWTVEKATKTNWMPKQLGRGDTREEAINDFVKRFNPEDKLPRLKGTNYSLYTKRRGETGVFIGKKVGSKYVDLIKFDTSKEAREYLGANRDKLDEMLAAKKYVAPERRLENRPRMGDDFRKGKDVTPEMFQEAFGFRGVEFGNWVSKTGERQDSLNRAYDALMDLSILINMPTKAMSLNGELALAFGARGKGGKNAFAAHYEPGRVVINLTRKNGPGSLAHEWFHALDNLFSRNRDEAGQYITERPFALQDDPTRPELIAALKDLHTKLKATGIYGRSSVLDAARGKEYWGTTVEVSARAFENYVISKMNANGVLNDYLVNIAEETSFMADMAQAMLSDEDVQPSYPYLLNEELPGVVPAFEKLFDTIETRETGKGIGLFQVESAAERATPEWNESAQAVLQGLVEGAKVVSDQQGWLTAVNRVGKDPNLTQAFWDEGMNTVFLNPAKAKKDSIFHEFTHPVLEQLRRENPALYQKGIDLVNKYASDYVEVAEGQGYDDAEGEALTQLIGEKGASIQDEVQRNKFVAWMEELWAKMKKAFKNAFNMDMTLDDFVNNIAYGMRSGNLTVRAQATDIPFTQRQDDQDPNGPTFYSALTAAVENMSQNKAPADQWMAVIRKQPGVKKEELEWSGVEAWLADQKGSVSRESLVEFLKANEIQVTETELSNEVVRDPRFMPVASALQSHDGLWSVKFENGQSVEVEEARDRDDAEFQAREQLSEDWDVGIEPDRYDPTKFSQYTTPGGSQYRELLLTLPGKTPKLPESYKVIPLPDHPTANYAVEDENGQRLGWGDSATEAIMAAGKSESVKGGFVSSHFPEAVNILAHIRFDERTDSEGRKVLHIAEIQSDWHQAGRKKGYAENYKKDDVRVMSPEELVAGSPDLFWYFEVPDNILKISKKEYGTESEALNYVLTQKKTNSGGVPSAPFKTTWPLLAMKRMIRYASEGGFEAITWDPGAVQVNRYKEALRKAVDKIEWTKTANGIQLVGFKDGAQVVDTTEKENAVSDAIGKTMGESIINSQEQSGVIEGEDITISDTGMSGFYDRILPNEVNKYVKKWGAKVESGKVITHADYGTGYKVKQYNEGVWQVVDQEGNRVENFLSKEKAEKYVKRFEPQTANSYSLPITPQMRSSALAGQPMFQLERPSLEDLTRPGRSLTRNTSIEARLQRQLKRPDPMGDINQRERKLERAKAAKDKPLIEQIKAELKLLKRGVLIGNRVTKAKLEELKKKIRDYAKENLPDQVAKSQVTPLLTAMAEAKTIKNVEKAFNRIDDIFKTVQYNKLRKDIRKKIKAYQPGKRSGKLVGTTLTADEYKTVAEIKELIEIGRDVALNRAMDVYEKAGAEAREPNDQELDTIYMNMKFGGIDGMSIEELGYALEDIEQLIDFGRLKHQADMAARKAEMDDAANRIVDTITGGEGVLTEMQFRGSSLEKTGFFKTIRAWDDAQQGLESLTDKLSNDDSPVNKSAFSEFVMRRVSKARNTENRGTVAAEKQMTDKLVEIYGVKGYALAGKLNENKKRIDTGIYIEEDGEQVELKLSQNEIYKKLLEWESADLAATFEGMGWAQETIDALREQLSPEVKAWADWQINEFYPQYYDGINEVYRRVYGVDLPKNEFYSPIYRDVVGQREDDLMDNQGSVFSSVANGHLKARVKNTNPLQFVDGDVVLMRHVIEMEHFKAYAEPMRDLRSVLQRKSVQKAITQRGGNRAKQIINGFLDDLARGGIDKGRTVPFLDTIRRNFVRSKLGLNPVTLLKQLMSFPAYTAEMPTGAWLMGLRDGVINYREMLNTLAKSDFLNERYKKGWERDVAASISKSTPKAMAGTPNLTDALLFLTKLGDKTAIVVGGWPLYKYTYKKSIDAGMSEEEARAEAMYQFEQATDRAQQSAHIESMTDFQRGGSVAKLFSMFQTAQNQYFRLEMSGLRNLRKGRGNKANNIKRFMLGHFLLPMLFQFAASGFRWDDEDQARAMILGSFNGIIAFGQIFAAGLNALFEGRWYDESLTPIADTINTSLDALGKTGRLATGKNEVFDEDGELTDYAKGAIDDYLAAGADYAGIPYDQAMRQYKNWKDIVSGDTGHPGRRALGFSKYSIDDKARNDKKDDLAKKYGIVSPITSNKNINGFSKMSPEELEIYIGGSAESTQQNIRSKAGGSRELGTRTLGTRRVLESR